VHKGNLIILRYLLVAGKKEEIKMRFTWLKVKSQMQVIKEALL